MRTDDAVHMAESLVRQNRIECDYLEYKRSATFKGGILKTACAFANNYMNREIGLILIGIEGLMKTMAERLSRGAQSAA